MDLISRRRIMLLATGTLLAWAGAAAAHEGGAASGIVSGLEHPVSGLDHVLAMVAVGIWGAQLGQPWIWQLPVLFPLMMACGGFLGLLGIPLPGVEIAIALSGIVLGAMIVLERKPPALVIYAVVGLFAVFHGHAHGTELPAGASGVSYSVGFVVATGLLHGVGILIGAVHRWRPGRLALRAAGLVIAFGGAYFMNQALS
jgi:urease accessory protein